MKMDKHFVVVRYEMGWGTGPGNGVQFPDEIQVMASSRTEKGAKRAQKKCGGTIRKIEGKYRRYSRNEEINC